MMSDPAGIAPLRAPNPAGAELRTAGTAATVPGGYGWYLVDQGHLPPFPALTGPDEADAFVAARLAEGSDHLKILLDDGATTGMPTPSMAVETAAALVSAAHDRGWLAIAHALTAETARQAVRAGVDVLGHVFVDRRDPALAYELGGTAVVPTLAVLEELFGASGSEAARPQAAPPQAGAPQAGAPQAGDPQVAGPLAGGRLLAADPRVAPRLTEHSRRMLTMGPFPLPGGARHDLRVAYRTVAELRDAGVTLLAGSDASNPGTAHGATLHRELALRLREVRRLAGRVRAVPGLDGAVSAERPSPPGTGRAADCLALAVDLGLGRARVDAVTALGAVHAGVAGQEVVPGAAVEEVPVGPAGESVDPGVADQGRVDGGGADAYDVVTRPHPGLDRQLRGRAGHDGPQLDAGGAAGGDSVQDRADPHAVPRLHDIDAVVAGRALDDHDPADDPGRGPGRVCGGRQGGRGAEGGGGQRERGELPANTEHGISPESCSRNFVRREVKQEVLRRSAS
ncbi:hypothetical protein GCM10020220_070360 [Nonomuraea rubra]